MIPETIKKKREKPSENYYCEKCNYNCKYLSDWNNHILTRKHKSIKKYQKVSEIPESLVELCKTHELNCELCNYKTKIKSNYKKHLLTSKHIERVKKINTSCLDTDMKDTIKELLQQNQEFKQMLLDNQKTITNNTINGNVTNNNINGNIKNTFNLNIFLNV